MANSNLIDNLRRWVGNILFSVYVFVIMLDPTNTILHLKEIVFTLFIAFNMVAYRARLEYLKFILPVYAMLMLTATFSLMQMAPIDYEARDYAFKSFLPLVFLLWIDHYDVIRLTLVPAFIVAAIYTTIYILVSVDTNVETVVYTYSRQNDDLLMMSHRYFYGIPVFAVYLRSTVCFSIALFTFYYWFFNRQGKRLLMLLGGMVVTMVFIGTGSRSTMLFPFFILLLVLFGRVRRSRYVRYFLYPFIVLFSFSLVVLVIFLASEKGEVSNTIKYAHLPSYWQLFTDHPLYMLIGEGPGSKFYSLGFHRYTSLTEWTYLELLRCYGFFSLIPLAVVLFPMYEIYKHRSDNYSMGIIGAYAIYLLMAGTNPLLFSSTGMLVLWSAYSYRNRLLRKEVSR